MVSSPSNGFTSREKAFYLDPNLVNFVRPGLAIKITAAEIAADGTIRIRFQLTDPKGLPLDREGITTPGAVSVSFIAAHIPSGKAQYVSYTTRTQTSPITNVAAIQAAGENNGTFEKLAEGEYRYTFRMKAPSGFDAAATHTIGAYGSRNLTEFDLGTQYDDDLFNFVPNGAKVGAFRDIVATATCNGCHDALGMHGGSRRSVQLCALCHTPQTVDPDTGNTQDLPVLIHKIHMGSSLPSVQAGGKYVVIGNAQSVHDYSKIAFPADARNCEACHKAGATSQADAWLKPTRAACGACHDNVNFATGENHVNLPQVSDNQCATCHTPQGELDFDASIKGAHLIPRFSKNLPGTVFELVKVDDGVAGKKPVVTFKVTDKAGKPILPAEMTRLSLVLAGPTTDYATYVSEDARTAGGNAGTYFWTFQATIPADAKGSFTVGIEGYRNQTLLPGTQQALTLRDAGVNKTLTFSVDGSKVTPRRQIVALAKCNACHGSLSLHGDNRNAIEQCVLCHNPTQTDTARRPANNTPAETIDFRTMVHRIHTGAELEQEYTVYGNGNVAHNYNEVGYPGDRRNCSACHVNGSEQLPLEDTLIPVTNPRGLLKSMNPTTAACTSCHSASYVSSHALANTTDLGESCATCHGPNAERAVSRVHAR
jgi:OmcA/MtrC family decaheme c-type cytochrome